MYASEMYQHPPSTLSPVPLQKKFTRAITLAGFQMRGTQHKTKKGSLLSYMYSP